MKCSAHLLIRACIALTVYDNKGVKVKSTDSPDLFTLYLYAAIHIQSTTTLTTRQNRSPL